MSYLTLLSLAFAGLLVYAVIVFNALVGLRNRADAAWSDIEVQLKRRHDMVGNLVEAVKGYIAHERGTLEDLVDARRRAAAAEDAGPREAGPAERVLVERLGPVLALAEGYPELRADGRFQDLHNALVTLEDAIQNARRYYNAVVRDYNTRIQSVPDMFVARPLGFAARDFFQLADPDEARAPEVRL